MNLFKKKKKKIEEQLRSRTILSSLYGERWNLKYLENKIKNFKIDAYTKAEVDRMHQEMENRLTNHVNDYNFLKTWVETNKSNISDLKLKLGNTTDTANANNRHISKIYTEIGNTNTKVESNKAEIDKLKNAKPTGNYAELDKENTFTKANVFNSTVRAKNTMYAPLVLVDDTSVANPKSAVNLEYFNKNVWKTVWLEIPVRRVHFYRDAISTPKNMYWFVLKKDQKIYFDKQWIPDYIWNSKDKWYAKFYMYPNGKIPIQSDLNSYLVWVMETRELGIDGNYWTKYVSGDFAFVTGYDVSGGQPADYYKDIYFMIELVRK